MSAMTNCSTGGVPILIFMRYSPPPRVIGASMESREAESDDAKAALREKERSKASLWRWKCVLVGS